MKARNLRANPSASVSLESGTEPMVAEGRAVVHAHPYPVDVMAAFRAKFDWDMSGDVVDPDGDFAALIELRPTKWLMGTPT